MGNPASNQQMVKNGFGDRNQNITFVWPENQCLKIGGFVYSYPFLFMQETEMGHDNYIGLNLSAHESP